MASTYRTVIWLNVYTCCMQYCLLAGEARWIHVIWISNAMHEAYGHYLSFHGTAVLLSSLEISYNLPLFYLICLAFTIHNFLFALLSYKHIRTDILHRVVCSNDIIWNWSEFYQRHRKCSLGQIKSTDLTDVVNPCQLIYYNAYMCTLTAKKLARIMRASKVTDSWWLQNVLDWLCGVHLTGFHR